MKQFAIKEIVNGDEEGYFVGKYREREDDLDGFIDELEPFFDIWAEVIRMCRTLEECGLGANSWDGRTV